MSATMMQMTAPDSKPRRLKNNGEPIAERGEGRLWQIGKIWWAQVYDHGTQVRQSSHSSKKTVGKRLLRRMLGQAAAGLLPARQSLRYEDLRAAYIADYVTNGRKSLRFDKEGKPRLDKVARLDKFFAGYRISRIDTDLMRKFAAALQAKGLENGTINRSLSALRRMFHIAKEDKKLHDIPHFPMLKESSPRQGFFEPKDYAALRDALPDYLRPALAIGYHTGMRRAEILTLRWEQVDFLRRKIRLNAGETKNDEGREIPIVRELGILLEDHHKRASHANCPFVCFRINREGKAISIGDFRKVWYNRCVKLGLGKIVEATDRVTGVTLFGKPRGLRSKPKANLVYEGKTFHDLRRTGVRNLVRAGVPEKVAMKITGHRTHSVFDRYNIVSGRDLEDAGRKLDEYLDVQNGANTGQVKPSGAHETATVN